MRLAELCIFFGEVYLFLQEWGEGRVVAGLVCIRPGMIAPAHRVGAARYELGAQALALLEVFSCFIDDDPLVLAKVFGVCTEDL